MSSRAQQDKDFNLCHPKDSGKHPWLSAAWQDHTCAGVSTHVQTAVCPRLPSRDKRYPTYDRPASAGTYL